MSHDKKYITYFYHKCIFSCKADIPALIKIQVFDCRTLHVRCSSSLIQNYDFQTFIAANERMPTYGPDSKERKELQETLDKWKDKTVDVPIVIGDEEIRTKDVRYQAMVRTK